MNGLRIWSLGLLGTAIVVVASYLWLDRPIALFVHDEIQRFRPFEHLKLIPDTLTPLAIVAFMAFGLRGLTGRPLPRFQSVLLLCGLNLTVAVIVKDQLKLAFGRTWPETWTRHNLSLIRDGAYGFHPFHGGPGYASFPSGHMTLICTFMTILWICYPAFWPVYAACVAAMAIGLIGTNFHFLGDVIAGGFLGLSVGWLGVALWEIADRQVRPQAAGNDADGHTGAETTAIVR
jgi:membrane-associated phospholipid phosphatase